ncbi:CAP domain-containing protein, partial [Geobacillus stearothermophilus]
MIEFLAEYLMTNRMGGKKMKKVVSLGLAFSLALGGVLPTFSSEPIKVEAAGYEFTKEQQEALDYINEVRKNIGLKPVKLNPFLIKAAENHANYLFLNKTKGHSEISGNKGFTGKSPSDRVKAVGGSSLLEGGIAEGVKADD